MKSKMKSTFAIIAVALMVIVAVVPMVGVFTESSADAIVVPDEVTNVTITGKVYNSAGSNETDKYVMATWGGSYELVSAKTTSAGYTLTIPCIAEEGQITNVTVFVITDTTTKQKDEKYSTVTFDSLAAGGSYNADLITGYKVTKEVSVAFKGAPTSPLALFKAAYGLESIYSIGVTYSLYGKYNATDGYSEPIVTNAVASLADDKFTPFVDKSVTKAYVTISKISVIPVKGMDEIVFDVTGNGTGDLVASNQSVTFTQYAATITSSLDLPLGVVEISSVNKGNYSSTTIKMVNSVIAKGEKGKIYYIYNQPKNDAGEEQAADKITYTTTYGSVSSTTTDANITTNNTTHTAPNLLYGTYTMGSGGNAVSAVNDMELGIVLATKTGTVYEDGTQLYPYVADGCYVAAFADTDYGAKYLKITSTGFAFTGMDTANPDYTSSTTSLAAGGASKNINVAVTGYTLLKGQLMNGAATATALARSVTMTITSDKDTAYAFGQPYYGNVITASTDKDGKYSVYLATGSAVKFAPGEGENFTLTNGGQYTIVGTTPYTYNPTVASKTMKFLFVDGDGKALEAVPQFYAKFGDDAWTAALPIGEDGTYAVYDGTVDLDDVLVYFAKTAKNTFDAKSEKTAVEYEVEEDGYMHVVANEGTYAIVVKNAAGAVITSGFTLAVNVYSAFVSETGNKSYTPGAVVTPTLDEDGEWEFYVSDVYVGVEIGAKAQDMIAFTITSANLIFDTIYEFDVEDASGVMTVQAYADSYSSTLLRLDEETGIPGIVAELYNGNTKLGKAVTDEDGEFTILSDAAINKATAIVKFTNDYGYEFVAAGEHAFSLGEAVPYFTSQKDAYAATIKDADSGKVSLKDVTVKGATTHGTTTTYSTLDGNGVFTADWKIGDIITFTATKGAGANNTYRTFAPYVLTEEVAASGIINLSTLESTYAIYVEDAAENGIAVEPSVKKLYAGTVKEDLTIMNDINKVTGTSVTGVYTVLFSEPGAGYEYIALPGDDDDYKFTPEMYTTFEDEETTLTSLFTTIYFGIADAAGVPIPVSNFDKTGKQVTDKTYTIDIKDKAEGSNMLYFIGNPNAKYSPKAEWKTIDNEYTFETSAKITGGVLKAVEQEVVFKVVDASLKPVFDGDDVIITAYDEYGVVVENVVNGAEIDGDEVSAIYEVGDYVYGITGKTVFDLVGYTFEFTDSYVFIANEGTYYPTFFTANGYDIDYDMYDDILVGGFIITAYDEAGYVVGAGTEFIGITVDLEKVAYFLVEDNNEPWTFGPSESLTIIANESYVTGSVPYSGKGNGGAVTIELYLEGNLVKEIADEKHAFMIDKYNYGAIIDLSGYVDNTAAVPFDSILVVYYENNVEIGYVAIDPYSTVNNIVTPAVEVYVAVLDAPSALIARHVSIAQVGNTATVSADGQFIVADDDAIYTDGQYIYTFAGWYVDNEKVSASPSFTFSLTENVVIVPEYTVKYEKISDANAQVDPEIIIEEITKENTGIDTNVLIIGIAAVIVALIAVVYAVIKKE